VMRWKEADDRGWCCLDQWKPWLVANAMGTGKGGLESGSEKSGWKFACCLAWPDVGLEGLFISSLLPTDNPKRVLFSRESFCVSHLKPTTSSSLHPYQL
jgi:hypothetical protein